MCYIWTYILSLLHWVSSDCFHKSNTKLLFVWFKGVGRRYAHVVLRKADIDLSKRAGELTEEEVSIAAKNWKVLVPSLARNLFLDRLLN